MNLKDQVPQAFWIVVLTLTITGLLPIPVVAQEGNIGFDAPLFKGVKDPKIVATQIRAAVPAYERGLALLNVPHDPETTASAVKYLLDAYHYLRGAYEGTQLILTTSKFPDPMLDLQNKQIMAIRWGLIACTAKREYLAEDDAMRTTCVESLSEGLRKLRIVSAMQP